MSWEITPEFVAEVKAEYAKLDNWYAIANNVVGNFALLWNECYADGRMTEGEFAKMVGLDLTQAYLRNHELYGSVVTREKVERQVRMLLHSEYGSCEMLHDFDIRPWRFAA
jgi:hypothetical protein